MNLVVNYALQLFVLAGMLTDGVSERNDIVPFEVFSFYYGLILKNIIKSPAAC